MDKQKVSITFPDFKTWAQTVSYQANLEAIQQALSEAFDQGRTLGRREVEANWWVHFDDSLKAFYNPYNIQTEIINQYKHHFVDGIIDEETELYRKENK